MATEKNNMFMILLAVFVTLIVGIVIVDVTADQTNTATSLTRQDQTLTLDRLGLSNEVNASFQYFLDTGAANADSAGDWRSSYSECLPTTVTLLNQTGNVMVVDTDYSYNVNGTLNLLNTANWNGSSNSTTVGYDYCPDGYLTQGWGRTVLNLTPGFFALALLGVAMLMILHFMKKEDII